MKTEYYKAQDLGAAHMGWASPAGWTGHLDDMMFTPRSYGIFYLTSIKMFVILLEKECFDHVVYKRF